MNSTLKIISAVAALAFVALVCAAPAKDNVEAVSPTSNLEVYTIRLPGLSRVVRSAEETTKPSKEETHKKKAEEPAVEKTEVHEKHTTEEKLMAREDKMTESHEHHEHHEHHVEEKMQETVAHSSEDKEEPSKAAAMDSRNKRSYGPAYPYIL